VLVIDDGYVRRRTAAIAIRELRDDFLTATRSQAEREASMMAMVLAADTVLTATLKALEQAHDLSQEQLTVKLEALRERVADNVCDREREDLALRDELAETRKQLASALKTLNPDLDLAALDGSAPVPD